MAFNMIIQNDLKGKLNVEDMMTQNEQLCLMKSNALH